MTDLPTPTAELRRSFSKLEFSVTRERSFVRPQHQHHPQPVEELNMYCSGDNFSTNEEEQQRETGDNELNGRYVVAPPFMYHEESRVETYSLRDGKQRRGGGGQGASRTKPTMEIYRPPNTRSDVDQANGLSLNVHAKEFVAMKPASVQNSRSSVNVPMLTNFNNNVVHQHGNHTRSSLVQLQQSKSSGSVLQNNLNHSKSVQQVHMIPIQQSLSSIQLLQGPRVHFNMPPDKMGPASSPRSPVKSCSVTAFPPAPPTPMTPTSPAPAPAPHIHPSPGIKRSKSLGAADVAMAVAKGAPELGTFPIDVQTNIRKALDDPNQLSSRALMELVRHIMERAVSSVVYALPAAKLCISIIEKEKKETFLESLLNSCQQWYQERDRALRGNGPAPRYSAFMQFLNEMYCELKRRQLQLKMQQQGASPGLVLLTLLCKCCQDCLKPPQTQGQTDSLFFVLTSVGRDLEQELPQKLNHLLSSVRDTFLGAAAVPQIRKTLLQLIELHAAHWQLTASAVMFYTTQQL